MTISHITDTRQGRHSKCVAPACFLVRCSALHWLSQRTAVGMWFSCLVRLACLLWGVCLACLFSLERRWVEAGAVGKPGFPAVRGVESGLQEYNGSPAVTDGWVWQGCCLIWAWLIFWLGQPGSVNWIWPCGEDGRLPLHFTWPRQNACLPRACALGGVPNAPSRAPWAVRGASPCRPR